jgi:hypothetical protein
MSVPIVTMPVIPRTKPKRETNAGISVVAIVRIIRPVISGSGGRIWNNRNAARRRRSVELVQPYRQESLHPWELYMLALHMMCRLQTQRAPSSEQVPEPFGPLAEPASFDRSSC